jgi:hypothetical protein
LARGCLGTMEIPRSRNDPLCQARLSPGMRAWCGWLGVDPGARRLLTRASLRCAWNVQEKRSLLPHGAAEVGKWVRPEVFRFLPRQRPEAVSADVTRSIPWWRIATFTLLIAAFIISLSAGRTIEAVVIGVLIVPSTVFIGAWIYESRHHRA